MNPSPFQRDRATLAGEDKTCQKGAADKAVDASTAPESQGFLGANRRLCGQAPDVRLWQRTTRENRRLDEKTLIKCSCRAKYPSVFSNLVGTQTKEIPIHDP
jgi:hypothetical protein